MKSILLISLLLFVVKNEKWYGQITGYDINDKNKYAGTSGIKITHFYLCGTREYYIHRLGDPWNIWSKSYIGCDEPAGNGVPIDGICITNAKYRVRLTNGNWLKEISRCNIVENNGETFAGQIGEPISSIAVDGGNIYSVAVGEDTPDREQCAIKVFKNLFGFHITFNSEKEILHFKAGFYRIFLKLIKTSEANLEGEITFNIDNGQIKGVKWSKKFDGNEIGLEMKRQTHFSVKEFKMKITEAFKKGIVNGKVSITFDPIQDVVIIEAITKYNIKDRIIFGGGFKINIFYEDVSKRQFMFAFGNYPLIYGGLERILERKKNPPFIPPTRGRSKVQNLFDEFFSQENLELGVKLTIVIAAFALGNIWAGPVLEQILYDNPIFG